MTLTLKPNFKNYLSSVSLVIIDATILSKIFAKQKSRKLQKGLPLCLSYLHPRDTAVDQHFQINECNHHNNVLRDRNHGHLNKCEKNLIKHSIPSLKKKLK